MSSNNPPYAVLELDKELYDFLLENCDSNMRLGLGMMPGVQSRDLLEKLVNNIELFKRMKTTAERGKL